MGMLYHYTNLDGFMGIMNSSTNTDKIGLWMSSTDYMNDEAERIHCVKVLANLIENIELSDEDPIKLAPLFREIEKNEPVKIKRYLSQYVLPTSHNLSLSLTKSRDFLPMWGRYAESGNGIAIGLNRELLTNALKDTNNVILDIDYTDGLNCNYSSFVYLKSLLSSNKAKIRKSSKKYDEVIYYLLNSFCNIFKGEAFSYENEVRVCTYEKKLSPDIKYRSSNGIIVPYKILELKTDIVQEIIIGPSKNPHYSKKSIEDFYFGLKKSGSTNMFKNSTITFRG